MSKNKYTIDYIKENNLILFEAVSGSHAYGTNTEKSDLDIKGVFIAEEEDLFGVFDVPTEVSDEKQDTKYYELSTFIKLLYKQNPNLLELLNVSDKHIRIINDKFKEVFYPIKDELITKKCKDTFAGYAVSQIKKSRGLNKKIVNPMSLEKKDLLDFCFMIKEYQTYPIKKLLETKNIDQKFCGVVRLNHVPDVFALYLDKMSMANFMDDSEETRLHREANQANNNLMGYGFKGIIKDNTSTQLRLSSVPEITENNKDKIEFLGLMGYREDAYSRYCKDYHSYKTWVENRNQIRYNDNMENGCQYDCYLDSETEYLTNMGWKKYDDIKENDLLGTFNNEHQLVFEPYLDRFKKEYTGDIYTFENRYTRFSVTPNHNLYFSDCHRTRYNNFSTKYDIDKSEWYFQSVEDFFNSERSHKHILVTPEKYNEIDYNVSDDFIKLLGGYISEGSLTFNSKKTPQAIHISQLENNRLCKYMDSIKKYDITVCKSFRKGRYELTYCLNDSNLAMQFNNECGCGSDNMKLPDYVYCFSKRQVQLLLEVLISGDGHNHKKGHDIYYSSSKKLINDLQLLLFNNGIITQTYYGYIDRRGSGYLDMNQLFISKNQKNVLSLNRNFNFMKGKKNSGWEKVKVENKDISCFTMSTGLIITKNKNKISVQGNSKNMLHTIRLLLMCKDIYTKKQIIVERPERNFLLEIKSGKYEYDYLLNYAQELLNEIEELNNVSDLREDLDMDYLNNIIIDFRKHFYSVVATC